MSTYTAVNNLSANQITTSSATSLPRLGFIGTGWIGRLRMEALLATQLAEFRAVHDASAEAAQIAAALMDGTHIHATLPALLQADLDGVVIATPSALHAQLSIDALQQGKAVFCQKPLARTALEVRQVVDTARRHNKLLGVDFSYRYLAGMAQVRELIKQNALGNIFAANLVFHNAYGPDKPWFRDVALAGGGCVIDLGVHLVDLVLWLLGDGEVNDVRSSLYSGGNKMTPPYSVVEDYAVAEFSVNQTQVNLSCSWNLHAGCDAIIAASFYGTQGGVSIKNVNGSFFDFEIFHFTGTHSEQLAGYPDDWGGRALIDWVQKLSRSNAYDPEVEQAIRVADIIDRIYSR